LITSAVVPTGVPRLTSGDVDIGVNYEDDAWDLHIHDEGPDVEYEPDEALLYVGMAGLTTRAGGLATSTYDFLGVANGARFFQLPQTENPLLLYLGIGGEELTAGDFVGDTLRLRLSSVAGPGHFSMWQDGSTPGTVSLAMATSDGVSGSDFVDVAVGGHSHYNYAFTAMGMYQVTFVAEGTLTAGGAISSDPVTYYFQVSNAIDAVDVQNGQTQRSFVRNVDLVFGEEDSLASLLIAGRVQVTKFDLNGNNGAALAASAFTASVTGDRLRLDFGDQGIGGSRNTNAGDGYYRIGVDIDGDGTADVFKHFYRLLGDVNGDRKVDAADRTRVMSGSGLSVAERDVNGDGVVNSVDLTLVTRALGKKLKDGLWVDD